MWSTLIFELQKPKPASLTSRSVSCSGSAQQRRLFANAAFLGPNSLGFVFVLFCFQEGHCLRVQLSEPGTALWACWSRADRKGFQSPCFECKIVCRGSAAYQRRAERSQCSNPGFIWVTSTGEAWKTWFIPLPEVAVGMIQTQPAILSRNHRQGLGSVAGKEESGVIILIVQDQDLFNQNYVGYLCFPFFLPPPGFG